LGKGIRKYDEGEPCAASDDLVDGDSVTRLCGDEGHTTERGEDCEACYEACGEIGQADYGGIVV